MRKYLDANIIFEIKDKDKKSWLEARKCGIGGSDAASVLGLNPYRSSMSVYLEKTNDNNIINNFGTELINQSSLPKNDSNIVDKETNYKMELGNKLENFVANEFTLKTGKKVRNVNGILRNDKYSFAISNIDRSVVGEKAFLECKVTSSYNKKLWEKEVPIHYQIQCYHYMAVSGATHCYVAALIGNEKLIIHELKRDEEIIDEIMDLEKKFWHQCVLGGDLPLPDGSNDYSKVLQSFYKDSKQEELILFEKEDVLNRYDDVCGLIKELDSEKKTIEQYIQMQMKEYEIAYLGERKITWKKQTRTSIDTTRLKKQHPEIVKEFMKTTTSRVFRI